jgi:hypothetical protein
MHVILQCESLNEAYHPVGRLEILFYNKKFQKKFVSKQ